MSEAEGNLRFDSSGKRFGRRNPQSTPGGDPQFTCAGLPNRSVTMAKKTPRSSSSPTVSLR